MNLSALAEPFTASEIEWRVGQAGMGNKGVWCKVLAYITNRAIMERLDTVCGPANWRNEYRYEQGGAVLCGISIFTRTPDRDPQWVTKWDGAENTDVEAVKGGLSNAMKRAAVQWGIGRYLYDLEEGWAEISENGQHFAPMKPDNGNKKGYPAFRWNPPKLPTWALPVAAEPDTPVATPATDRARTRVTEPANGPASTGLAVDHLVRGKKLGDHTGAELNAMQKALRAEGKDRHKILLADITTVLNDRLLGPSQKAKPPVTDETRGANVVAASAAVGRGDGLPFD